MRSRLSIIAAALAAAGCGRNSTEPARDLRVTTTVAPAAFYAGDTAVVTVSVTNTGSAPHQVYVTRGCPEPFTVRTLADSVVGPASGYCALVTSAPRTLQPGERYDVLVRWPGDARERFTGGPWFLAAGEYVVRGEVFAAGAGGVLQSEPVPIRILP